MTINLKTLNWDLGYVRYFYCIIFVNLDPFLIVENYWTNLKFEYLFRILYISGYLLWAILVFAWANSANLLAEYKFMTRGVQNFME